MLIRWNGIGKNWTRALARVQFFLHHEIKFVLLVHCLKLMVAQSSKKLVWPVQFDPGQVKIIMGYIRREFLKAKHVLLVC